MRILTLSTITLLLLVSVLFPADAVAHCDTMDGPVAKAGLLALKKGSLDPALRWVGAEQEVELRHVYDAVSALRKRDEEVREVVDRYFLETLVRLHRASEGAPYTGLKPAGTPIAPAIHQAEEALATGSASELLGHLTERIQDGLEERLHHAVEAAGRADASVEEGRKWVEAYVEFVHYVEAIDAAAAGLGDHGHDEETPDH